MRAPSPFARSSASPAGTAPRSYIFSTISSEGTLTDIMAESARFLTRPQLDPSGVSLGQMRPKWVACRSRASKLGCVRLSGDWTLRRWLMVER